MSSAFAKAFEAELSKDARAILAYARKWGTPFTRTQIIDIAPGAAWDVSPWPKTVAKVDPIRELVRAGLIEELDEVPVRTGKLARRGATYKRWKLTGPDAPRSLSELLDAFAEEVSSGEALDNREAVRAEILRRFGARSDGGA